MRDLAEPREAFSGLVPAPHRLPISSCFWPLASATAAGRLGALAAAEVIQHIGAAAGVAEGISEEEWIAGVDARKRRSRRERFGEF